MKAAAHKEPADSRARLHASLALLPDDPTQAEFLHNRLLAASPLELPIIWGILREHDREAEPRLWKLLEDAAADHGKRFRAACALASADSGRIDEKFSTVAPFVADRFLAAVIRSPGDYAVLIETLRPLGRRLVPALSLTFRDHSKTESQRSLATSILADYAADDAASLADLLMSADATQYVVLFPVAQKAAGAVQPVLQAEIEKRAAFQWDDAPPDPAWVPLDPASKSRIEAAQGSLDDHFAFCQTVPLDGFLSLAEGLRKSGYRPVRFRPYADGPAIRVAAVWARDGRRWRMTSDLTRDEALERDKKNRDEKYVPVDVSGYVVAAGTPTPSDRFAVVWVESSQAGEEARIEAGLADGDLRRRSSERRPPVLCPWRCRPRGAGGQEIYCGVWRKADDLVTPPPAQALVERGLAGVLATNAWSTLTELGVTAAASPPSTKERATANLKAAEASMIAKPDDPDARLARAVANYELGNHQASLDDLDIVLKKAPQTVMALQYRAWRTRGFIARRKRSKTSPCTGRLRSRRARSATWPSSSPPS